MGCVTTFDLDSNISFFILGWHMVGSAEELEIEDEIWSTRPHARASR